MNYPSFNRRHKAGLFLVIVAAGIGLFLEASVKQTAGVVLLGLAATWLIASVRLQVLWLASSVIACCFGIAVAGKPVLDHWEAFRDSAQNYDHALSDLRQAIASSEPESDFSKFGRPVPLSDASVPQAKSQRAKPRFEIVPPERVLVFDDKKKWIESDWRDVGRSYHTFEVPSAAKTWVFSCSDPPVNCVQVDRLSFPLDVDPVEILATLKDQVLFKPSFSFWSSLTADRPSLVIGSTSLIAGLFSLGWLLLRRLRETRAA